jgi:hypothetical protein
MTGDRPKIGDAFRAPDRVGDLAGLLGPPGLSAAPTPPRAATASDAPAGTQASVRSRGKTLPPQPRPSTTGAQPQNAAGASLEVRVVPVVLDVSVMKELRPFAVRMEQTQGAVALRAIEANAAELAAHWSRKQKLAENSGRLFGPTRGVRRRTEPGVQTQLRLAVTDAATLDQLVSDWSAPSRSALVNEALRRYVCPNPHIAADRPETKP